MSELRDLVPLPHIWQRMDAVEHGLLRATRSGDEYLTAIARHLLTAGGKRYRPLLALLAAELGPGRDERPVDAGVAVELIHVGSLYHDDVIDEADTRRGAASANANWSNTRAILAGDFLMARASEHAAAHLGLESVRLLAATYAELVEGQTRELQLDFDLDHDLDAYEVVIRQKTASLIRTSARLGALAADAEDDTVETVSDWALEVGMVFQIADDVLDLVATAERLGKPAGSDIREGKFTMPVLMALRGPDADRVRKLLDQPRPYPDESVAEVIDVVRAGGHAAAALDHAVHRLAVADRALERLPANPVKQVLSTLGEFLVQRVASLRPV